LNSECLFLSGDSCSSVFGTGETVYTGFWGLLAFGSPILSRTSSSNVVVLMNVNSGTSGGRSDILECFSSLDCVFCMWAFFFRMSLSVISSYFSAATAQCACNVVWYGDRPDRHAALMNSIDKQANVSSISVCGSSGDVSSQTSNDVQSCV